MNRRTFLKSVGASAALGIVPFAKSDSREGADGRIDRKALVFRHKIVLKHPDRLTPLSVGNGEFAFTADVTGLQTFPEFHDRGMLLQTMAQWSWHTTPDNHN